SPEDTASLQPAATPATDPTPVFVRTMVSSIGCPRLAHRPSTHAAARARPLTCHTPGTSSVVCAHAGPALTMAIVIHSININRMTRGYTTRRTRGKERRFSARRGRGFRLTRAGVLARVVKNEPGPL